MKAIFTFLSVAGFVCGQSLLGPPKIGFIQDGRGSLRPVLGLEGNFLIGRAGSGGVVSAAFSGTFGLVKSDSALVVIDQHGRPITGMNAPPGPALFAFAPDGRPALAFFAYARELCVWDGQTFRPARLDRVAQESAKVWSVAISGSDSAKLLVEREDGLWELQIRIDSGATMSQTALPALTGPVMLLANGGLVYGNSRGLVFRKSDGSEKEIAANLPRSFTFVQMGDGWIAVRDLAAGRLSALCIQDGRERYYALPVVRQ